MRLMTFRHGGPGGGEGACGAGAVHAGVLTGDGIASVPAINAKYNLRLPDSLLAIVQADIRTIPVDGVPAIPLAEVTPRLPWDAPPKIWCIGLNYLSKAADTNARQPEEPGSFMKPASCMFEPGEDIVLPPPEISNDVDAEGELGVVIGRKCRYVPRGKARQAIYGYTTTMDLTALDILSRNPRYLTRSKSIDTFFSFGPVIVTADEVEDVDALEVVTELNGEVYSKDFVRNMKTRPDELVAFHSEYMTLCPGDLISTGCPKGARIKAGDRVRARIDGIGTLEASVRAGERTPFGFE